MYSILLIVALIGSSAAGIVDFRPCEGNPNQPQVVQVDDCVSSECGLSVGETRKLSVEFVSPFNAKSVQSVSQLGKAKATSNACDNVMTCPVQKGGYYRHSGQITVTRDARSASSLIYKLETPNHEVLACFTLGVNVA